MFKKSLAGVAIGLVVAAFVLGPGRLWTTLRGAREVAREAIEEEKSDVQRLAEIRTQLGDLDGQLARFGDKLAEVEQRAADAGRRVQRLDAELERQRELLRRAKEMLDGEEDSFTVSGRRYSRDEVGTDALARVGRCEQLVAQLDFERSVARQLTQAVTEAKVNWAKAQRIRQQKSQELTTLAARLENAKLLVQVNDLTRDLHGAPLGPQTELGQNLEAFERRVATVERRASTIGVAARSGQLVDWDGGAAAPDARTAIDRFLGNGSEKNAR